MGKLIKRPTIEMIAITVAYLLNIDLGDLRSERRESKLTEARHMVIGLADYNGLEVDLAASYLNRHRTTSYNSLERFNALYETDPNYQAATIKARNFIISILNATTIDMKRPLFAPEPDLWPEGHTDLFTLDIGKTEDDRRMAIEAAVATCGEPIYDNLNLLHIATSDQVLVDELKDQLYGCEIAYVHRHIPEHYG
ncbi:MAG: hypothetical protein D6772_13095 [Bacteroidetes bacterium]|nr:MAG: hypothetical protein D6772_13095 [Bacteroidota bacterium]